MLDDYSLYPKRAIAGLISTIASRAVGSYAAEGAVHAGAPLIRGSSPEETVKVAGEGDGANVFGIAAWEYKDVAGGALYRDKETVSVLRAGAIYVEVAGEVTPGAPAFLVIDGGRAKFSADDQAGEALGVGVIFESAAEDGLALVSVGGQVNINITHNITSGGSSV
jgi:hypothetical protein